MKEEKKKKQNYSIFTLPCIRLWSVVANVLFSFLFSLFLSLHSKLFCCDKPIISGILSLRFQFIVFPWKISMFFTFRTKIFLSMGKVHITEILISLSLSIVWKTISDRLFRSSGFELCLKGNAQPAHIIEHYISVDIYLSADTDYVWYGSLRESW